MAPFERIRIKSRIISLGAGSSCREKLLIVAGDDKEPELLIDAVLGTGLIVILSLVSVKEDGWVVRLLFAVVIEVVKLLFIVIEEGGLRPVSSFQLVVEDVWFCWLGRVSSTRTHTDNSVGG